MSLAKVCRLCAKDTKLTKTNKIFDVKHKSNLKQIEALTGLKLKNGKNLPRLICQRCQTDLDNINCFRERCIKAQNYFKTKEYKNKCNTNTSANKREEFIVINKECEKNDQPKKSTATGFVKVECVEIGEEVTVEESDHTDSSFELSDPISGRDRGRQSTNIRKGSKEPHDTTLKSEDSTPKKIDGRKLRSAQEFICDKCGNHLKSRYRFLMHLQRHTGEKSFQCELCPDKFYTQSELNRHMRRHTGERPFACMHCERRFTDYTTRIRHERTHTNERPFRCSQCNKAFSTAYVLKNHMLIHTGERAFKCDLCDKSFQRQTNLSTHFRSMAHRQKEENHLRLKGEETIVNEECIELN